MKWYARLAFFLGEYSVLEKQTEKELFRNGEASCKVKVQHTKRIGSENSTEQNQDIDVDVMVIFSYGPFVTERIAVEEGKKLLFSVRKSFVKNWIPISIFNEFGVLDSEHDYFDNGGLTTEGKENSALIHPELEGYVIENGVLGLKIYQLEEDISKVKFFHQSAEVWCKTEFPKIELSDVEINSKLKIAYSLLNSSLAINDLRTSFILKVSAVEALVSDPSYQEKIYCDAIDQIMKLIKIENIPLNELNSSNKDENEKIIHRLKSSIGSLKKKTIAEKCNDLIEKCDLVKNYYSKDATIFFKDCYQIRSNFVHTGKINKTDEIEEAINILKKKTGVLHELVIDILENFEQMEKKTNIR
ncbi:HEPN domain-containing protein [Paenibacillus sp. FSL R10-2796]|uniref:HEPN domain-containing protein n=1 Tax=Paenibacillus TaxID=44249 RepID=UPI00096C565A|nr:HEPN domain-containing protein [Paenibacillus odorifer]OMD95046.1 hypothetical protein BSK64_29715 [Paenibacillus odorifer]